MSTINNHNETIDMISEDTTNEELAKVLCDLQQGHIKPSSNLATSSTAAAAELSPPSPSPAKRFIRSNPDSPPEETSTTLLFPTASVAEQPAKTEATATASRIPSTVLVSDESSSSSPTSHNNNNNNTSLPSAAALSPSSLAAAKATAASALTTSQSAALPSFPVKLYEMMQDSVSNGFEDVVSWQTPLPGVASSFKVQNTHRFVDEIMPRYFKQTKFKSFQRQLNIYNFQRVHDGPNRGGYYHPYFVRNAPELLKLIPRKRMSLTNGGVVESRNDASVASVAAVVVPSAASVPTQVAATNPLAAVLSQPLTGNTSSSPISTMLLQALAAAATPVTPSASADQQQLMALLQAASANEEERHRMLQQSLLLLSAANTAGLATHSPATNLLLTSGLATGTSDQLSNAFATSYGTAANPTTTQHLSSNTNSAATNQHVFPWKLYKMLEEAPAKKFDHIVSWVQNGTAFKVHNAQGFLAEVIYQYFDQSKYESFRRQLNLYGFTRVVRGRHRGVYSHPFFRQGHQDWCRFITRQQPSQLHGGNNGSTNNQDNNPPQPYAGSEDDDDHDESESSPPRQQAKPTDTQIVAASSSSANNSTSV
ncbi:HSF-type DNA-binding protein [Nitzschia inconspicua]|uniref:HSF-type DNA-binding protein n=1 Tax=Nitzschia inconspicua TaxID=303405 RepID=A0A9K3KF83_9STRA|nr:HSF-type DNA-binding protein [Nitzschia inconspicua]